MKKILFTFLIATSSSCFSLQSADSKKSDVKVVQTVDLDRYQGKWFEVASIPQSFQKKCAKNTEANYKLDTEKMQVEVLNICTEANGRLREAEGRAKIVDKTTNAKLKVTFVKLISWIFAFGGDYWVIGLDPDYQWVVVGHPDKTYGWILSRTPAITDLDLKNAYLILKQNKYDTCKILTSIQDGGFQTRKPLCEIYE